jgi:hypothetical protein
MPATARQTRQVLAALAVQARPRILQRWREDSCIATTRICLDVCRALDISARPAAVTATAFNAPLVRWIREHPRGTIDEMREFQRVSDGHSVGVGYPEGTNSQGPGWSGHLVLLAPAKSPKWLLDASIDQASRPQHAMRLTPTVIDIDREFMSGKVLESYMPDGTMLWHQLIDNKQYLQSPDWTDRARRQQIVADILNAVRAQLR